MLTAALLFAPLLAGYIFATTWKFSRYRMAREDSQRLYFRAAFYGVFLGCCAILTILNLKLYFPSALPFISSFVRIALPAALFHKNGDDPELTPIEWSEISLFIIFTLAWGTCLGFGLNYGWMQLHEIIDEIKRQRGAEASHLKGWRQTLKNIIHERGDDLEMMLLTAIEKTAPIQITMENKKVYVGSVVELIDPCIDRKYLRVLPLLSGYRRDEDCRLVFTTSYDKIYEQILDDKQNHDLNHLLPEDFEIILPISLIQSVNLFDFSAYLRFTQPTK